MNLNKVNISLRNLLKKNSVDEKFIDEVLIAAMRDNYNSNSEISAVAGLVTLIALTGELVEVEGGNVVVVEKILEHIPNLNLNLNAHVNSIRENENEKWTIQVGDENKENGPFDIVVIATPIHLSKIKIFKGETLINSNLNLDNEREYNGLFVSIVTANAISKEYFKFQNANDVPGWIATVENQNNIFTSIGHRANLENGTKVFKIFSKKHLKKEDMSKFFDGEVSILYEKHWESAYPKLRVETNLTRNSFPNFKLQNNLYYTSPFENLFSALEGQTVSGKNVALLIKNQYQL